jgi:hypothetical protein
MMNCTGNKLNIIRNLKNNFFKSEQFFSLYFVVDYTGMNPLRDCAILQRSYPFSTLLSCSPEPLQSDSQDANLGPTLRGFCKTF